MGRRSRFSPEVRERAVRMVREHQDAYDSQWAAITSIAEKFGCSPETLRKWVRQVEVDDGDRPGATTARRRGSPAGAREPPAAGGQRDPPQGLGVFRPGGARPPTALIVDFINDHREVHDVESMLAVLPIASSTYYTHAARGRDPTLRPAREKDDVIMRGHVRRVWQANHGVYGARKVWKQLHREGITIGRCRVQR